MHIDPTSDMLYGRGKDVTTHLEAVQEIIREDEPRAPDAQHAQDVAPEGLLRHPAVDRAVCLLQITPGLSLLVPIQSAMECRIRMWQDAAIRLSSLNSDDAHVRMEVRIYAVSKLRPVSCQRQITCFHDNLQQRTWRLSKTSGRAASRRER